MTDHNTIIGYRRSRRQLERENHSLEEESDEFSAGYHRRGGGFWLGCELLASNRVEDQTDQPGRRGYDMETYHERQQP